MNKPDWKDAPEWAEWLAQDTNGAWCWYENEPVVCTYGYEASIGKRRFVRSQTVGPMEPRPKPKVRTVSLIYGQSVEFNDQGGAPFRMIWGPCTITITEP